MQNFKRTSLYVAIASALTLTVVSAQAALPAYVGTAIQDAQTSLTDLVGVMVTAAVVITLLSLTPKVLIRMIRGLGSKVAF